MTSKAEKGLWQPAPPLKVRKPRSAALEQRTVELIEALRRKTERTEEKERTCPVPRYLEVLQGEKRHALYRALDDPEMDPQTMQKRLSEPWLLVSMFAIIDHRDRRCPCFSDPDAPSFPRTRFDPIEEDIDKLKSDVEKLVTFAKACFAGAGLLVDASAIESVLDGRRGQ